MRLIRHDRYDCKNLGANLKDILSHVRLQITVSFSVGTPELAGCPPGRNGEEVAAIDAFNI